MAIGTGNLPFPGKVYNPFDILTAEELNEDVANIESLADGSGIGDGAITTAAIDDGAVTAVKTAFGGNYSTSEVNTGFKWIDDKAIYKKTINFGALPNNTAKNVAHGISTLDRVVDYVAITTTGGGGYQNVDRTTTTGFSVVDFNSTNVVVTSNFNKSGNTDTYITMWYTKT